MEVCISWALQVSEKRTEYLCTDHDLLLENHPLYYCAALDLWHLDNHLNKININYLQDTETV